MAGTFDLRAISGALNSSLGVFTTQSAPPIPPDPLHVGPAELPRVVPQYTPSNALTGTVHTPANAAALQALTVEGAGIVKPGDTIVLTRGVTYNTPSIPTQFFRNVPGAETNPIRVITSDTSAIPMPGARITPAHRASVPHFRQQLNNTPAVRVLGSGWHFVGIEADAGNVSSSSGVIVLGYVWNSNYSAAATYARGTLVGVSGDPTQGWISLQDGNTGNPLSEGVWWTRYTTAIMPTNIVLDRCDISARLYSNQANVVLYCETRAVVIRDCWLWGEGRVASEDKAFLGVELAGPMLFENNMCCSSSIPFLTGGGDPRTGNVVTDMTVRRNHFFKPTRFLPFHPDWDGNARQHKNSFELKVAERALIEDNVFENHYDGNQSQFFMVVFKCANQQGTFNDARTLDVTFRYNRLVNPGGALGLGGVDRIAGGEAVGCRRFSIYENYTQTPVGFWASLAGFTRMRSWAISINTGGGRSRDMHMERNTLVSQHPLEATADNAMVNVTTTQMVGLVFRGNIVDYGASGIFGDVGSFIGVNQFGAPGSSASGNWLYVNAPAIVPSPAAYPAGVLNTTTDAAQVYVNRAGGNYRAATAIATQGHDGGRPGANIDLINQRTAGCETGVWT